MTLLLLRKTWNILMLCRRPGAFSYSWWHEQGGAAEPQELTVMGDRKKSKNHSFLPSSPAHLLVVSEIRVMGMQHAKSELSWSWTAYTHWKTKVFDKSTSIPSLFKTTCPKILIKQSRASEESAQNMLYSKPTHLTGLTKSGFNFLLCARHPLCLRQVTWLSGVLVSPTQWQRYILHEGSGEHTHETLWGIQPGQQRASQRSPYKWALNTNSLPLIPSLWKLSNCQAIETQTVHSEIKINKRGSSYNT